MAAKKKSGSKAAPPPAEMLELAHRVRRAMRARDPRWTQEELEKEAGISQSAVSNLVSGKSARGVTLATIARVALAMGKSLDFFVLGRGESIPDLPPPGAPEVYDETGPEDEAGAHPETSAKRNRAKSR